MRLAQRLLLGALIVVGVLSALIFVIVDRQMRERLRTDASEFLATEARLAGELWQRQSAFPDSVADRMGAALGRRVTLIATDGTVLGDSEFDDAALRQLQNHASRPEVAEALSGRTGAARRPSPSTRETRTYVAIPVAGLGVARVSQTTATLDAVMDEARRDLFAAALVALLIALVIAWFFSRSVTRPVVELRDVAKSIAAGDLSRRPTLGAPGEVGELATALRELADQLSSRLKAIESDELLLEQLTDALNEGVVAVDTQRNVVRINERARRLFGIRTPVPFPAEELPRDVVLREALQTAFSGDLTEGAELVVGGRTLAVTARPLAGVGAVLALFDLTTVRRLESVRRDFVANVSHELRTPLTVIGGFAETLATDDVPADARHQFAERILSNTRRMQRIVDDLLDLSRIESGGWVPNPEDLELAPLADELFASSREEARAKGIALVHRFAPETTHVFADATAIRQVLGNLVDNAVRHTASGEVVLFAEPHERGVTVGVRDTGSGIAAEHLPRVFERFYRVDPGRSRDEGGTGLGLAIVKHLVEAHGGRLHAESTPGRGTTISALFPRAGH